MLGEYVRQTLDSLSPLLKRNGLTVVYEVPAENVACRCDPGRLAQVVTNLVENAGVHAYQGAGGEIRIGVRGEERRIWLTVADSVRVD